MEIRLLIQRLLNWTRTLVAFKTKSDPLRPSIPDTIPDSELIVRYIFSPVNFNKKNKLRSNAFTSPKNKDEVSVMRFDYCTETYCKQRAKLSNNPPDRNYHGLGVLTADIVRFCECDVISSPIRNNPVIPDTPEHADIIIGHVRTGDELPAEFSYKVGRLAQKAKLHIDPNPGSLTWDGPPISYSL
jgi:hypothetical protein